MKKGKRINTVKTHAGTPKLHYTCKVHLKNLASYTGPKHSSGKPAVNAHVKIVPKDLI